MNWLILIYKIVPGIVLGLQTLIGDKAAGATKQQMALDMTDAVLQAAVPELGTTNAALAQAAASVTKLAINQAVDIHKATGAYQKATAAATAAQQDAGVAAAVVNLVQTVTTPAPVPAA